MIPDGSADMDGEDVGVEVAGTYHRSSLDIRAVVVVVGNEDSLVVVVLVELDILAVQALICIITLINQIKSAYHYFLFIYLFINSTLLVNFILDMTWTNICN